MKKESYKFDENSPVISYKDGSFGFNYKNVEASVNALKNMLACEKIKGLNMNKFREWIEEDIIAEMSSSFWDQKTSIRVNPTTGNEIYFKYCDTCDYTKETNIARISFLKPEYVYGHRDGHGILILSSKARSDLNKKLSEQSELHKGFTVFQSCIIEYNKERYHLTPDESSQIVGDYQLNKPLPINLKQPNYNDLPNSDEAIKIASKKKHKKNRKDMICS